MFDTLKMDQLLVLLDQFSVPMFVCDRKHGERDFCIAGTNRSFDEVALRQGPPLLGRRVVDAFIAAGQETGQIGELYDRCARGEQTVRLGFCFAQDPMARPWQKVLQRVSQPDGTDRIIATAIKVGESRPTLEDRLAFEDVRYFSSIADLQLANLSNAFSTARQDALGTVFEEQRMVRLHAVCRTIQQTMSDIKEVVRGAQCRHGHLQSGKPQPSAENDSGKGMDTVRALSDAATLPTVPLKQITG